MISTTKFIAKTAALSVWAWLTCVAAAPAGSPRVTPTVELIARVQQAIVPIFCQPSKGRIDSGTGTLLREDGFILTADHVTREGPGIAIFGNIRAPFRIVGRMPEKDIALLKVPASAVPYIPLGRSNDVRAGEPVIAAGNPGGRGIAFSAGIISAVSVQPTMPNALAATFFSDDGRDDFLQFDAAINRGNSGGPLVNAEGRLIGVVAQKKLDEEAISWAIPIDRVRRLFGYLLPAEEIGDFWVGLDVDLLASRALVRSVAAGSPAATAGVAAGDVLVAVDGQKVATGPDWLMLLSGRKSGQKLTLDCERAGRLRHAEFALPAYPLAPAVSQTDKAPGLRYATYSGKFKAMPDFRSLQPAGSGTTDRLQTTALAVGDKNYCALVLEGYLAFPKTGLYRLMLTSDDGSRLLLDGTLRIDNDRTHPPQELGRWVRVSEGLHPLRIEYFNHAGQTVLKLEVQPQGETRREVPPDWFFRDSRSGRQ